MPTIERDRVPPLMDPRLIHQYRQDTPGYPEFASQALKDLFPSPAHLLEALGIPLLSDAASLAIGAKEGSGLGIGAGLFGALPFVPGTLLREGPDPKKIIKAYRALRLYKSRPGEVFPAMIKKGSVANMEPIPMGKWLQSEFIENKELKPRWGYHGGEKPYAPQFHKKHGPDAGKMPEDMVWTEVDMDATRDWQKEANKYAPKSDIPYLGAELPYGTRPENGFYRYRYRENQDPWIISDAVRHNRLLTDEEVYDWLRVFGIDPPGRAGGEWTMEKFRKYGLMK